MAAIWSHSLYNEMSQNINPNVFHVRNAMRGNCDIFTWANFREVDENVKGFKQVRLRNSLLKFSSLPFLFCIRASLYINILRTDKKNSLVQNFMGGIGERIEYRLDSQRIDRVVLPFLIQLSGSIIFIDTAATTKTGTARWFHI